MYSSRISLGERRRARNEWITAWISTHLNIDIADLLTKPMSSGEKRNGFVKKIRHIFSGRSEVITRKLVSDLLKSLCL